MITCQLKGGFGNQLFQIFSIIAYSLDNKFPFKFLYSKMIPSITPRESYWDTFLKSLKFFTINQIPNGIKIVSHSKFEYETMPVVNGKTENICFDGYFQSYKYFNHQKENIYRLIQLEPQRKKVLAKYRFENMSNTISLHFRLGDYKHLGHTHPIMSVNYYIDALTYILSKATTQKFNVLYFCEKEDNEYVQKAYIEPISNIFYSVTFQKVNDEMADWEQVLLMSHCNHNVIANSSFSWFGAYFNTNKKHVVCYPSVWFAGEAATNNSTADMFPPSWIKIKA